MPDDVAEAYAQLPEQIDFNFNVRSILADRCFKCHGPDAAARKGDLRLDDPEAAFAALSSGRGHAIVSKKPGKSILVDRILSHDPDLMMPPPESNLRLSAEDKAVLIKWIEQGGTYRPHWAYDKPVKSALPDIEHTDWPQNPIDYFILETLENQDRTPSTQADKRTLLRRLTFDLTGLPPTPEQLESFLQDNTPDAYERQVDALLASNSFGERWAWDWLDAARYADTNGFQGDPERKMWPWRDWVIQAINENMPYDQFTVEQLAGDLLPGATQDQVIATGFNRNHMYNGEGGRIPEETRVENVFDRVETLGTVWLGMTLN